jgi:hypothetical protein
MSMSIARDNIANSIQSMDVKWDGDIIDLDCDWKDHFCYAFLNAMESWWDDILPHPILDRRQFLNLLYNDSDNEIVAGVLRDDIYLTLEPTLRELVQEVYDEVNNTPVEQFAGYNRGQ